MLACGRSKRNVALDAFVCFGSASPTLTTLFALFDPRSNVFSWEQVVRMSPVERLDHAFSLAKDQLAVERLLDPEGIR